VVATSVVSAEAVEVASVVGYGVILDLGGGSGRVVVVAAVGGSAIGCAVVAAVPSVVGICEGGLGPFHFAHG